MHTRKHVQYIYVAIVEIKQINHQLSVVGLRTSLNGMHATVS